MDTQNSGSIPNPTSGTPNNKKTNAHKRSETAIEIQTPIS